MKKIRYIAVVLVLLVSVLLGPVESVQAAVAGSMTGERFVKSRSGGSMTGFGSRDEFPVVTDFSVDFDKRQMFSFVNFSDWFNTWETIEGIEFKHKELASIDYSQYYLVCDIVLISKMEDGTLKYTNFSDRVGFVNDSDGLLSGVSSWVDSWDGYYNHYFDYSDIMQKRRRSIINDRIIGQDGLLGGDIYTYNSVVSSMDFYFVRISDGKCGKALRCQFTWEEDFYAQELVGIDYYYHNVGDDTGAEDPEGGAPEGEEPENPEGGDDDSKEPAKPKDDWHDEDNLLDKFGSFLKDIPEMFWAILVGVIAFVTVIVELISVLFPYIPGVIWFAFGGLLVLSIGMSIWKLIFK